MPSTQNHDRPSSTSALQDLSNILNGDPLYRKRNTTLSSLRTATQQVLNDVLNSDFLCGINSQVRCLQALHDFNVLAVVEETWCGVSMGKYQVCAHAISVLSDGS